MARVEKVQADGQEFALASLTMDQVEEFFDDRITTDPKHLRGIIWRNIMYSLRNAGSEVTLEELKKKLTLEGFGILRDKVMEVSGLAPKPGENQATPTPTSPTSGVASLQP